MGHLGGVRAGVLALAALTFAGRWLLADDPAAGRPRPLITRSIRRRAPGSPR